MTHEEFQAWLQDEVQHFRMTAFQMKDLLDQKLLFDNHRTYIEQHFQYRVVGYINAQRKVADTVHVLLDEGAEQFPDRMTYFEPVGFDLL